jgi:iron complex transport system substrate-binding protein
MRTGSASAGVLIAAILSLVCGMEAAARPARVVSMNVCTDQLAVLLAHPGQIHSVSWLAADPDGSVLADRMAGYVPNHGTAEEIFLMKPDLVLAGTYTTRATVDLLRRLGFRVEEFEPEASFEDIRGNIRRMAQLLDHVEAGERLVSAFDSELEALRRDPPYPSTLALYYANSYTSGSGTLADEVVAASGLRNLGRELGYAGTARLPLEMLVAAAPDLVAGRDRETGYPAKAEENYAHPAYRAITTGDREIAIESKYWVCGTPFTLHAAKILSDSARQLDERKSAGGRK